MYMKLKFGELNVSIAEVIGNVRLNVWVSQPRLLRQLENSNNSVVQCPQCLTQHRLVFTVKIGCQPVTQYQHVPSSPYGSGLDCGPV